MSEKKKSPCPGERETKPNQTLNVLGEPKLFFVLLSRIKRTPNRGAGLSMGERLVSRFQDASFLVWENYFLFFMLILSVVFF